MQASFRLAVLASLLALNLQPAASIWIGEEFWTSIYYDGSIEPGRSTKDFIPFNNIREYDKIPQYVGYWIDDGPEGRHEAFGEAFIEGNRVCGRFVQRVVHDKSVKICNGFRVLSLGRHDGAQPFEWAPSGSVNYRRAVRYLTHEVSQIVTQKNVASIFGGAYLNIRTAYGVDPNGTVIHLHRSEDAEFYDRNVLILYVKPGYHPPQYVHHGPRPYYNLPRPLVIRRPYGVSVAQPVADPVAPVVLPRIYKSRPEHITDENTWRRHHPNHRPGPYENTHLNIDVQPYRHPHHIRDPSREYPQDRVYVPERQPVYVPEQVPEQDPRRLPGLVPAHHSERVPVDVPEQVPVVFQPEAIPLRAQLLANVTLENGTPAEEWRLSNGEVAVFIKDIEGNFIVVPNAVVVKRDEDVEE